MLSSPGIGSGLDVNGIVSQLMAVERQPTVQLLIAKKLSSKPGLTAFGSFERGIIFISEQSCWHCLIRQNLPA
jgi:flagellar capping protein FliD